jgi:glycerate 2-kinase
MQSSASRPSRVLIAPDSFKGSLTAVDVCAALASGWRRTEPDAVIVSRPMADGGEGTLDAFLAAVPGAQRIPVRVLGPVNEVVDAAWALLPSTPESPGGTAVVELASTSGIELLGRARYPWDANTIGFGQAIAAALDYGVTRLILGIGSSASIDGGNGLLTALGARFVDERGHVVARGLRGIREIAAADFSDLRATPSGGVMVLTDVSNPLLGVDGAAAVFGPQKGLPREAIADADGALMRYSLHVARALRAVGSKRVADPTLPSTGAAGGVGFALRAWGAELTPGAPEIAALVGLEEEVSTASVVIIGEGSYDRQTGAGKAPAYVAALARDAGVSIVLVAGRVDPLADITEFSGVFALSDWAGSSKAAFESPSRWLSEIGSEIARRVRCRAR